MAEGSDDTVIVSDLKTGICRLQHILSAVRFSCESLSSTHRLSVDRPTIFDLAHSSPFSIHVAGISGTSGSRKIISRIAFTLFDVNKAEASCGAIGLQRLYRGYRARSG